jgi:hypothetical protein
MRTYIGDQRARVKIHACVSHVLSHSVAKGLAQTSIKIAINGDCVKIVASFFAHFD